MSANRPNVLFLCTGNTARSILAEAILRKDGAGKFNTFSAGSQPKGSVNPAATATLQRHDYSTEGLRSKSWNEFASTVAPQMDFVITVCANASGEVCPVWPGHPATAHWGIDDPASAAGAAIEPAFERAFQEMKLRISTFLALPFDILDQTALLAALRRIGNSKSEGNP